MPRKRNSDDGQDEIDMHYRKMVHYREKHAGWAAFKAIYWAIYILALGVFFLVVNPGVPAVPVLGFALVLFAMFYAIFGLVKFLHYKLMKKHA